MQLLYTPAMAEHSVYKFIWVWIAIVVTILSNFLILLELCIELVATTDRCSPYPVAAQAFHVKISHRLVRARSTISMMMLFGVY